MRVYRVIFDAYNSTKYDRETDRSPSQRFRYDVFAMSPTDAIAKAPKTHYSETMWFPGWDARAYIRRTNDAVSMEAMIWGIAGADEVSVFSLRKSCRGGL